MCLDLEVVRLRDEATHKKLHTVWFGFYKTSRTGRSVDAESRLMAAGLAEKGRQGVHCLLGPVFTSR